MSNEFIKIPIWIYHCLIIVCEFTRKCCKTVTVTDSVFMHGKLCIKLYTVNLDARDISYGIEDTCYCYGSGLTAFGSI